MHSPAANKSTSFSTAEPCYLRHSERICDYQKTRRSLT
nr:MAG TPA: hypothetical protein [Caudoviricetes sp.]DAO78988.1 MAG TPA: hypothetical protein [Caudoviricetes sp.]